MHISVAACILNSRPLPRLTFFHVFSSIFGGQVYEFLKLGSTWLYTTCCERGRESSIKAYKQETPIDSRVSVAARSASNRNQPIKRSKISARIHIFKHERTHKTTRGSKLHKPQSTSAVMVHNLAVHGHHKSLQVGVGRDWCVIFHAACRKSVRTVYSKGCTTATPQTT